MQYIWLQIHPPAGDTRTRCLAVLIAAMASYDPDEASLLALQQALVLGDLDGDGTLRPRPSIDKLRPHVLCRSQAIWTSLWAMRMAISPTWRTPGRLRCRCSCNGLKREIFDGIYVGRYSASRSDTRR